MKTCWTMRRKRGGSSNTLRQSPKGARWSARAAKGRILSGSEDLSLEILSNHAAKDGDEAEDEADEEQAMGPVSSTGRVQT